MTILEDNVERSKLILETKKLLGKLNIKDYKFTGTIVYGPFTKGSDIDVVVNVTREKDNPYQSSVNLLEDCVNQINEKLIDELGMFPMLGYYFLSIKVELLEWDRLVNLIFVDEAEYEEWVYATDAMKTMLPMNDRKKRHRAFEALRKEYATRTISIKL